MPVKLETREHQKYLIEKHLKHFGESILDHILAGKYEDLPNDTKVQILDTLMKLFSTPRSNVVAENGFIPAIKPQFNLLVNNFLKMSMESQHELKGKVLEFAEKTNHIIHLYGDILSAMALLQANASIPREVDLDTLHRYLIQLEHFEGYLLKTFDTDS